MTWATEVNISKIACLLAHFFFPTCPNAMERSAAVELPEARNIETKKRELLDNHEPTSVKVVRLAAATVGEEARLGHASAGNPPNPRVGVGPGLPGRSRARDVVFQVEARAAFVALKYNATSRIPVSHILARNPTDQSDRDKCPFPFWILIQEHGGYFEKGRLGVTRTRIRNQHTIWRRETFGSGLSQIAPTTSKATMLDTLQHIVPFVEILIADTKAFRHANSSVNSLRPWLCDVDVWTSLACKGFWENKRSLFMEVYAEATHDHHEDPDYLRDNMRTGYLGLEEILVREADIESPCTFCVGPKCLCLVCVVWEAVDMFAMIFTQHVVLDPKATSALISPPDDAVLPGVSEDALYNIAGALLWKVKRYGFSKSRANPVSRQSFATFADAHALSETDAKMLGLPVDKVVRQQYGSDSLTFVSEPLYAFFCHLELVYSYNLSLRNVDTIGASFLQKLNKFARSNMAVIKAWEQCTDKVVEWVHPNYANWCFTTDEQQQTAVWLQEAQLNSACCFDLIMDMLPSVTCVGRNM